MVRPTLVPQPPYTLKQNAAPSYISFHSHKQLRRVHAKPQPQIDSATAVAGGTESQTQTPPTGGVHITPYLCVGALGDTPVNASQPESDHITKHWTCPRCGIKMLVNRSGADEHARECQEAKT